MDVSTCAYYCIISSFVFLLTGGRHNNPFISVATRACRRYNPYVLWMWLDGFVWWFAIYTRLPKILEFILGSPAAFLHRDTKVHPFSTALS
jgi:hypothetical protein